MEKPEKQPEITLHTEAYYLERSKDKHNSTFFMENNASYKSEEQHI